MLKWKRTEDGCYEASKYKIRKKWRGEWVIYFRGEVLNDYGYLLQEAKDWAARHYAERNRPFPLLTLEIQRDLCNKQTVRIDPAYYDTLYQAIQRVRGGDNCTVHLKKNHNPNLPYNDYEVDGVLFDEFENPNTKENNGKEED